MESAKAGRKSVRVYPMAAIDFSLTIQEGMVVLMRADPGDEYQHWYKDDKYGDRVKDASGFQSFALINKATGLALKHATGPTRPVQLIPHIPDAFDETVLWTESNDPDYQAIRMVNNISMNLDVKGGDYRVEDGSMVVLWEWNGGENQRWRIASY